MLRHMGAPPASSDRPQEHRDEKTPLIMFAHLE
jgi:hypothetical protein